MPNPRERIDRAYYSKFMTPFQQIARKLTRSLRGKGTVTPEQVQAIANGTERTASHPVIAQIMSELKRQHPKTRGHRATNDSHLWEE